MESVVATTRLKKFHFINWLVPDGYVHSLNIVISQCVIIFRLACFAFADCRSPVVCTYVGRARFQKGVEGVEVKKEGSNTRHPLAAGLLPQ